MKKLVFEMKNLRGCGIAVRPGSLYLNGYRALHLAKEIRLEKF